MSTQYPNWHWIFEWSTSGTIHAHAVKSVYVAGRTKYQSYLIAEFEDLGKALVIDGKMQSSLSDEYVYHESLVQPPLLAHGSPRTVLILGGGEGATAREALKFRTVEKVVMVDIDGEIVEACKKYLPEWHKGAFNNPKLKVVIDDAEKYIRETNERFDAIIADLVDPQEGGPAWRLYTKEFYELVKSRLAEGGVFVTQATSPTLTPKVFATIYSTLKATFRHVLPYTAYVRSFEGVWSFIMASDARDLQAFKELSDVDSRLQALGVADNRFYDSETHRSMFSLPKPIRNLLASAREISTLSNPVYIPA